MMTKANAKVSPAFGILDAAVIAVIVVVFGSGVWRLLHDDSATIARTAIAALGDDARAASYRPRLQADSWRVFPGADIAHAEE